MTVIPQPQAIKRRKKAFLAFTMSSFHPRGCFLHFPFPLTSPSSHLTPPEKASDGGLSAGRAMAALPTDSSTPNYPQISWRANVE